MGGDGETKEGSNVAKALEMLEVMLTYGTFPTFSV